ncbi:MazG-like nucleotide pyrophosphohydrolase [Microbacterium phage Luna18]|nr:MazG-like nucleotide pyrophosphohydrolase [Microbacterium phage KatChan]URQ04895.1 MazG-like nucleotide pyrophosphohydrolase [Microbacterium phage Luna18]
MNKMQQQNAEFNRAFKRPVRTTPTALPEDEIAVSVELIREEFEDELIPALQAGDLVESVDACADILYVTFGLLNRLGVDVEPVYDEVQRSNMSKLGEDGEPIIAGPNDPDGIFEGRIKKGPNYFVPDIARLLQEQGWEGPLTVPCMGCEDPSPHDGHLTEAGRRRYWGSEEQVDHGGFEDH